MTYFIFVTGGVCSSLGKGLAAASLGALLQSRGYSVRLKKLDPYLNIDPGTMSPFEHGEVFVTDDGAEADLDLGHYERFTGVSPGSTDSVSAGKIYSSVFAKERHGDYLGSTIQVIPHVTDTIKEFIANGHEHVDFMLCEIGGTIGDIEALPFLEAIRQFSQESANKKCIFVHLTLLPYISVSNELKTKPTQHSVKELRSLGIHPNVLVCRSASKTIPERTKEKIALFCNIPTKYIVSAPDLSNIYEAPVVYHESGIDSAVLSSLGLQDSSREPDLSLWRNIRENITTSNQEIKIAIVGKYAAGGDPYLSLVEALCHAGIHLRTKVINHWIDSEDITSENVAERLGSYHGILVPGGFGVRGSEGKIISAGFARTHNIPYFGICLGMQMAIIEAARNLAGMPNATSREFYDYDNNKLPTSDDEKIFVIDIMEKWTLKNGTINTQTNNHIKGGTMRLGSFESILKEDSRIAEIYGSRTISERHRHRFEVNPDYINILEQHGLFISGTSCDGMLPESCEYKKHPWFIGVQFHPELKSRPFNAHPLFVSFIRAALRT